MTPRSSTLWWWVGCFPRYDVCYTRGLVNCNTVQETHMLRLLMQRCCYQGFLLVLLEQRHPA